MRAIGILEYGGPDVLQVVEVPTPHAGSGEIRIRVHAVGVNPTELLIRLGDVADALGDQSPPYIPGMDAAGVIDEIGDDADTDLQVGERVMAMVMPIRPEGGSYAEYVVLPASWVARAPKGTSHAQAATLPMNGLTARMALDMLALDPGDTLAVTGAAGALGGYVLQLARAEGLWTLADAAPSDEELIRNLGADVVVPRGDGLAGRLRAVVPDGVDAVVDAALIGAPVLAAIRNGGGLVRVRAPGERGVKPLRPCAASSFTMSRYQGMAASEASLKSYDSTPRTVSSPCGSHRRTPRERTDSAPCTRGRWKPRTTCHRVLSDALPGPVASWGQPTSNTDGDTDGSLDRVLAHRSPPRIDQRATHARLVLAYH